MDLALLVSPFLPLSDSTTTHPSRAFVAVGERRPRAETTESSRERRRAATASGDERLELHEETSRRTAQSPTPAADHSPYISRWPASRRNLQPRSRLLPHVQLDANRTGLLINSYSMCMCEFFEQRIHVPCLIFCITC